MIENREREDFLKPEVRCGFLVDEKRKRLWKALLDMLEVVMKICDKHGIRYFLDGGSLLGAVRHKGIIPWDDDVDITVLRADYEKLQNVLPKELPSCYFMQTSATDPQYTITHIKIRDNRTSAIATYHARDKRAYNMGVFLDIFPFDGMPTDVRKQKKQLRDLRIVSTIHFLATTKNLTGVKRRIASIVCRVIYKMMGSRGVYRWRERIASRYSFPMPRRMVSAIAESGYKVQREMHWYRDVAKLKFEYLTCSVPIDYEACLKEQFGDWRVPIVGTGNHGNIDFDLDVCYKDKLIAEYGYSVEDFKE